MLDKNLLEYLSGMTSYAFDESVLNRIALDRGVMEDAMVGDLTKEQKDLIFADMLFTVWSGPNNLPSFTHQHGQFSHTIGQQTMGDKDRLLEMIRNIYKLYEDEKLELLPEESNLQWMP